MCVCVFISSFQELKIGNFEHLTCLHKHLHVMQNRTKSMRFLFHFTFEPFDLSLFYKKKLPEFSFERMREKSLKPKLKQVMKFE